MERVRSRAVLALTVTSIALLATPADGATPARSQLPQRVTTIQFRFVPDHVLVPMGETLIYTNIDFVEHNIVSERVDPDGKPLFEAPLLAPGESAPVARVETLPLGTYAFYCAPHPWMVGKLEVFDPPPTT